MAFTLSIYPWVFYSRSDGNGGWHDTYVEKPHKTPAEEAALSPAQWQALLDQRNSFPELPLVNYTTQYGLGCFEGLKAFPQPDGSLKLFRPDRNGARMERSMIGLKMPGFPMARFVEANRQVVAKNAALGFRPQFQKEWEKDNFQNAEAIYLRPFSYSEPAIGLGLSTHPWVVVVATPVSSYFKEGSTAAVTTDKIRATPKGTGWIKCDANYVIPTLAKKEAEHQGYMEAIFLDAKTGQYIEEGSSCNFFAYLKNGSLVTPELGDTILPGITRESILTIAADLGIKTEVRKLSVDEVLAEATEVFVTGTAAGVSPLESLTHQGQKAAFSGGNHGEVSMALLKSLKGIQYGVAEDKHGWMVNVS
ncbi:MAG: branched-chain-amino-acid transaminase [Spirochaetales bacterium]|nr:branched-chain-amino-acid transaminase [Spirochaetales bacterium]